MDWSVVNFSSGIAVSNITVPNSCCAETRTEVVGDIEVDECVKLYANGCLPRVFYLVYQSAGLLGAGAMTIAFIQVCVCSTNDNTIFARLCSDAVLHHHSHANVVMFLIVCSDDMVAKLYKQYEEVSIWEKIEFRIKKNACFKDW